MGLRISIPVFPGVRYTASSRRRRKGELNPFAVFVVFMAIAIPISFAIKYWQWTLTIGIPIVVFLLITRSRNIAKRRSGTEAIKPDAGA
jgi:hypothetical protein